MDRQFVYAGQIPLETDILNTNQNVYIALGKLAATLFGTNQTMVNGFGCTPTAPASMSINVASGEIYSQQPIDGSGYSALNADTTHQIVKQGILLDGQTISLNAPTTTGQSVAYLVQVAFQEQDSGSKVLQYYNPSNPAQSYSGVSNSGQPQPTVRQDTCVISVKAGVPASTGSQATPAPDVGYIGLWIVTIANGQTTIQSQHIAQYPNAPFINSGLLGVSPAFNVSPTAPTPSLGDTTNKVATMAALQNAISQRGSQLFLTSSTFTVPSGITKVFISACAGGAGGGGGAGTNGDSSKVGGGGGAGGGAGQCIIKTPYTVTSGGIINITIGAGGAGGAGGAVGQTGGNGGAGGNTIIGTLVTLIGGAMTYGGNPILAAAQPGSGALPSAGYPQGGSGTDGALAGNGGGGAASMFGGGGGAGRGSQGSSSSQNGTIGGNFGSGGGGGGGAYGLSAAPGGNGGDGAPGFVLIEW